MQNNPEVKASHQGFLCVWGGLPLHSFLRFAASRPPMHVSRIFRILPLPLMATYNSLMGLVENVIYGRRIARTEPTKSPVFIIGHWRSGTTLLHELMSQDPQFAFPNLYQVFFPSHFLTTETLSVPLTSWMVPKSRPMDNVKINWRSTQEDEIALLLLTLLSPYMVMAFPDQPEKYQKTWDLKGLPKADVQRWKNAMALFVKKLAVRDRRQQVMKSPGHTMKIPHILDLYPDARFLYIYRNPYNVIRSGVHLRRTICEANTLGRPTLATCEEDVLTTYEQCIRTYLEDRKLVPEGQLHEVRFEDLEQDPVGELERAYEKLGLGDFGPLRRILEPQLPAIRSYKKNRFDENEREMRAIYERLKFAFDEYGYASPLKSRETAPSLSS